MGRGETAESVQVVISKNRIRELQQQAASLWTHLPTAETAAVHALEGGGFDCELDR